MTSCSTCARHFFTKTHGTICGEHLRPDTCGNKYRPSKLLTEPIVPVPVRELPTLEQRFGIICGHREVRA
jgi:hypothetical protein